MPNLDDIRATLKKHGQDHLLATWDTLDPDGQKRLMDDLARIDFAWVEARRKDLSAGAPGPGGEIVPAPVVELPNTDAERGRFADARTVGEDALRQGKVAAFLVAGGQGTRLGFNGPKGAFPVGPISGRTLFQWHAEQILARSIRYRSVIPWYIMTSRENDADTKAFFDKNNYFGLSPDNVVFFQQDMVPCLDKDGKMLLADRDRVAMNPNGHGGSLFGLRSSGALDDMRRRGIEYISYFQVDNPLVTICDPVFLGLHIQAGSEMSSKVLQKAAPDERIGVACIQDGKPTVVEYIDMDEESQNAVGPDGRLTFWAGSIAIHIINVEFVERVAGSESLPWHQSRKKVPYYDGTKVVKPTTENAIKFETFVFDALPFANAFLNLEVSREHEFAPVKNATGIDSAESSRQLLSRYFAEWLVRAGVAVPFPDNLPTAGTGPVIEISPLYALDADELAGKVKPGGLVVERTLLLG